ncbi:YppF family protein [Mesobacillus subterraneus]|uniref:YppF family protein n=1 Tax=Mesobacillus subterraneus TaxID=285983 RepID=UPI001CFE6E41|nr:YppF family protein [Mesobacillus subterraneus]WLR56585.1 YppF family protein [Mesobacillus subterraneus]
MNVHELKNLFAETKECSSEHVNELLDFTKKSYIQNEITILEYRNLVRELELQGAFIPEDQKEISI